MTSSFRKVESELREGNEKSEEQLHMGYSSLWSKHKYLNRVGDFAILYILTAI